MFKPTMWYVLHLFENNFGYKETSIKSSRSKEVCLVLQQDSARNSADGETEKKLDTKNSILTWQGMQEY